MEKYRVLTLSKTRVEYILSMISLLLVLGSIVYLLLLWGDLPRRIPIHFNLVGKADGWGHKWVLWLLPVIQMTLWMGLTIAERFPHTYNYVIDLTEENLERQYKNARLMMNVLKAEITIFFAYLSWESIQAASGHQVGLGIWNLPIFLIVVFGSLGFFIVRSFRLR